MAHAAFVRCKTTVTDTGGTLLSTPRRVRQLGRMMSSYVGNAGSAGGTTVRKAVTAAIGGAGTHDNIVHRITGLVFVTVSSTMLLMAIAFLVVAIDRAQVSAGEGRQASAQHQFVRWASVGLCVVSFLVWFVLLAKKRNMDALLHSALRAVRNSVRVVEQGTRGRAATVETRVRAGTDFKGARDAIRNFLWTALLFPAAVYAMAGLAGAIVGAGLSEHELARDESLSWDTHFAFGMGLGLCLLGIARQRHRISYHFFQRSHEYRVTKSKLRVAHTSFAH